MSDPLRLRPVGEHAALVRDRLTALTGAELVEDRTAPNPWSRRLRTSAIWLKTRQQPLPITVRAITSACRSAWSTG